MYLVSPSTKHLSPHLGHFIIGKLLILILKLDEGILHPAVRPRLRSRRSSSKLDRIAIDCVPHQIWPWPHNRTASNSTYAPVNYAHCHPLSVIHPLKCTDNCNVAKKRRYLTRNIHVSTIENFESFVKERGTKCLDQRDIRGNEKQRDVSMIENFECFVILE